jgi:uncharacterized protein YndB with AHSA1/START domain
VTTTTDVRREITVPGSPERVFDLFTNHMIEWWPAEHHVLTSPLVSMTLEPRVGGRVYDTGEDGSECAWGQITEWHPPSGFAFGWMLTSTWQAETDIDRASRVSVSFTADGDRTRVEVVHNEFWRLADGGAAISDAVASPDGWQLTLGRFAEFAGS